MSRLTPLLGAILGGLLLAPGAALPQENTAKPAPAGSSAPQTRPSTSPTLEPPPALRRLRRATPDEERAVKADFESLRQALLNADGAAAAELTSPNTLQLYDTCAKLAVKSTRAELEQLRQSEVIQVFLLRTQLAADELQNMDGKATFAWNVRQGYIRKDSVNAFELTEIQIGDGFALAGLMRRGGIPIENANFRFVRGQDKWLMDFVHLVSQMEPALEQMRRQQNLDKVGFALRSFRNPATGELYQQQILTGPLYRTRQEREAAARPAASDAASAKSAAKPAVDPDKDQAPPRPNPAPPAGDAAHTAPPRQER
jgi:hypothetical protein